MVEWSAQGVYNQALKNIEAKRAAIGGVPDELANFCGTEKGKL